MSNIYTSYLRIKRRDKNDLSDQEIEYLFNEIVNVHETFGSYWVRIVKRYRKEEKCLDIQFGSGKRIKNILSELINFDKYFVVERINYENSKDWIFEYEHIDSNNYASMTEPRICLYAFDRILITSNENWLEKEGAESKSSSSQELKVSGIYNSSNCKAFVDLFEDSDFYGPKLGYDKNYSYDYFVLTETDNIEFIVPIFLVDLQKNNFEQMPNNSKLTFLFEYRKVLVIRKGSDNLEIYSADYWDNCIDENYMKNK
jgi:hypothetical protein